MPRKALGRGLDALIPNASELLRSTATNYDTEDDDDSVNSEGDELEEPMETADPGRLAPPGSRPPAPPDPRAAAGGPATLPGDSTAQPRAWDTGRGSPGARPGDRPASGADPKQALASGRATPVIDIATDRILPNPYQPRSRFDETELAELAASIRSKGVLQPVLLRRHGGGYELIAGERRLRAARRAGFSTVPAIIRDASDKEVIELALIENEQRVDLSPIECARSYARILEEFQLTQSDLADVLGRDRSTVSNLIRLLRLPEKVQALVQEKQLAMGHARALLALIEDPRRCESLAARVVKQGLSVRSVERMAQAPLHRRAGRAAGVPADPELVPFVDRMRRRFGTQVTVRRRQGRGKIEIEFYSQDDLERILGEMGVLGDD